MATELQTLQAIQASGTLNISQAQRLAELQSSGSQGDMQGIIRAPGSGGSSSSGGQATFDSTAAWSRARQQAFDQLTPYYTDLLARAKGDVDLAKRYLEEDYQRGLRQRTTSYNSNVENISADKENQLAQNDITNKQETFNTIGKTNNSGTLFAENDPGQPGQPMQYSQYAKNFILDPQAKAQQLRTQAIQRALDRQQQVAKEGFNSENENAGVTRDRGIEKANIDLPRTQQDLAQQQLDKAQSNATTLYQVDYNKFQAANQTP